MNPINDTASSDGPSAESVWDGRYAAAANLWSRDPNPALVAAVGDLAPGRALDAGCGEGVDALWLARQGWRVVGVDVSGVALTRAAKHADDEIADRIRWLRRDLESEAIMCGPFHLVTALFLQVPRPQRPALHRALADLVAPGGRLVVVGHDPADAATGIRRPPLERMFTAADVAATLDPTAWSIHACEARPRTTHDSDGAPLTVHDAVLTATRQPLPPPAPRRNP